MQSKTREKTSLKEIMKEKEGRKKSENIGLLLTLNRLFKTKSKQVSKKFKNIIEEL